MRLLRIVKSSALRNVVFCQALIAYLAGLMGAQQNLSKSPLPRIMNQEGLRYRRQIIYRVFICRDL